MLHEIASRPGIGLERARELALELYGVEGPISELGSHQDRNYRIDAPGGPCVLKIANRTWGRAAIEAQSAALLHVTGRPDGAGFEAPVPLAGLDGELIHAVVDGLEELPVRLLTYIEGETLAHARHLSREVVGDLGRLAGHACIALSDFEHPGLDRVVQWDVKHAAAAVEQLLESVAGADRRRTVSGGTAAAMGRLGRVQDGLRVQAIHGDVTDYNVVGRRDGAGRVRPDGVIDFGDLTRSWLVAELAVTCAAVIGHDPAAPFATLEAIREFDALVRLCDEELEALWPLVVLRAAALVVNGQHQALLDPDNESATEALETEWSILEAAQSVPFDLAEAVIRDALGRGPAPRWRPALEAARRGGRLFPEIAAPVAVDLSTTSDLLRPGEFLGGSAILADARRAELDALRAPPPPAATRYGEARLTRTFLDTTQEPATCALGVELSLAAGTAAAAPWPGVIRWGDEELVIETDAGLRLLVAGLQSALQSGARVQAGDPLGSVGPHGAWVRLGVDDAALEAPELVHASTAAGWMTLCPDPSAILGAELAAPRSDRRELLARRLRVLPTVQEHYYRDPMRIESGWRAHMFDTAARAYLDVVNNVAAIGHGHPRMAAAIERQLRLLNTNSRFHYAAIVELSERLAALAPGGLDTVLLVNSGSEAVDLALRIAQAAAGRPDVVAVTESYHGWTMLSDAVSTSLYDNPRALETRPEWVHLVSVPNPYRGRLRGSAAAGYAQEVRSLVAGLVQRGRPPAAFICEPVLGNAGGVLLPEGYLAAAYEATRAAGGICIADEVQVGYGRLGHHWWGFEASGVEPDVITIAKAMGNGHPIGAVITRRALAEAFAAQGPMFSSTGGSPASCVAGLVVLEVIEQEGLQRNAAEVGDHLRERLLGLMDRHELIGAVHGMGFYLGVELVRGRSTLEPAAAECAAICERMRELGVIVQPTGERANVLKIKPPMCLTRKSADFFAGCLDRVLSDGW